MSSPLITNCSPFGVATFPLKKPPTFTSIIISSSDDDTRRSWIFTGLSLPTPIQSCALTPNILNKNTTNIKVSLFITNQLFNYNFLYLYVVTFSYLDEIDTSIQVRQVNLSFIIIFSHNHLTLIVINHSIECVFEIDINHS